MAPSSVAEMLGQVRETLGLPESSLARIAEAIDERELTDEEVGRLVDAVGAELVRINAERYVAATMHRVDHEIVETEELVETFEEHPDNDEQPKRHEGPGHTLTVSPGRRRVTSRTNAIAACPDCGRELVAARLADSPVHTLVCSRLHGLSLASVEGLTPNDVVACGITETTRG